MTDHLGNIRVVVSGQGEVVQRNDYYAFGLAIDAVDRGENKYLFLNRELQPETGYYDLIHRQYDPAKARFDAVDPKPDDGDQESLSTYQYGLNNPILRSDPNGDCVKCWEAIKKWWNTPISPLAQETGKAYMHSMIGREIPPTTQGQFIVAAIGYAGQRFGGSVPGSNKIRIPQGGRNKSGGDNSTPVTAKIGESENINVGSNSTRITQFNPNVATGEGFGVNDTPVRISGSWTLTDLKNGLFGTSPKSLGSPDLHHAGQMPGSGIHEISPIEHRKNTAVLHPNKSNQGVTPLMREQDRQLHWWYRARKSKVPIKYIQTPFTSRKSNKL